VAVVAMVVARSGAEPDETATAPTTIASRAPAPSIRSAESVPPVTAATGPAAPTGNVDTFCVAGIQFKIDPDPASVAAKFLANPGQVVRTVDALVENAPADVTPTLGPLRDDVHALAARVYSGELRTTDELRNAVDPTDQTPAWPRFDLVVVPAISRYCQRYL
jgi:hypothetical protein